MSAAKIFSTLEHAGTCRKNVGTCRNMPENEEYPRKYQNTGTCRNTAEKLIKKPYYSMNKYSSWLPGVPGLNMCRDICPKNE